MKTMLTTFLLVYLKTIACASQNNAIHQSVTIAFYNLENLFDYDDDPLTFDDDRTPYGRDQWTEAKYRRKLNNMGRVIKNIGSKNSDHAPAIVGVCEIENKKVLQDLVRTQALAPYRYAFEHFDSPDRRGIDVALLYQPHQFKTIWSKKIPVFIFDRIHTSRRIFTRDQLLVYGLLSGEPIYILVNHWPSRSGGQEASEYRRQKAADVTKHIKDSLLNMDPKAKIVIMGDFNDNPDDNSIKNTLKAHAKVKQLTHDNLYNPLAKLYAMGYGSLAFNDRWFLFDQIITTKSLVHSPKTSWHLMTSGIYNPPYLQQPDGPYKFYPYRSVQGGRFTGGYSDHYPVYIQMIRERPEDLVQPLLPRQAAQN
ncbi:MAG: endonuclease/exonuclease/phosphatase family protein [Flavobacteriaceae bacterium]|nr:endonuclease/exonuclease/phosphatase family protein [Flavobacteriaceae bacterium]MDG1962433.1 endonuclease/exonuclease/phosphatase family protein [Flavobacteriaceae bacterium]